MDERTTDDIFNAIDESTLPDHDGQDGRSETQSQPGSSPEKSGKHKEKRGWRGFSALKDKASMQDKLLEKLLQQVIPADDNGGQAQDPNAASDSTPSYEASRPNFTLPTMSTNFRRFNARIGVVFKFQTRIIRLLSWRRTSHTLSFLAVYTLVCLDPYLLSVLPLAILLLGVFIPSFIARHPSDDHELAYSPRGPPRAPARTVKPVKELSRDFFGNMRDLQNSMEDFSRGHDQVITYFVPKTNFSDEALSSALFVALFAATLFMTIAAHLLPWRLIFLCLGWGITVTGHPVVAKMLEQSRESYMGAQQEAQAKTVLDGWVKDIILDSAPETREVEIFELQRRSDASEWEAWLFSPSPYDPLSQPRITGERPMGTRFFEDVFAPEGWVWSEKKWALDLYSREWVEERIITGVEVETEGERWVYDIYNENEVTSGVVETNIAGQQRRIPATLSWEEGEEGEGRRGEWRRRRWVRLVKRKSTKSA